MQFHKCLTPDIQHPIYTLPEILGKVHFVLVKVHIMLVKVSFAGSWTLPAAQYKDRDERGLFLPSRFN